MSRRYFHDCGSNVSVILTLTPVCIFTNRNGIKGCAKYLLCVPYEIYLKMMFRSETKEQNLHITRIYAVLALHEHPERNHYCVKGKKPLQGFAVRGSTGYAGRTLEQGCVRTSYALFYCFTAKLRPNRANGAEGAPALRLRW